MFDSFNGIKEIFIIIIIIYIEYLFNFEKFKMGLLEIFLKINQILHDWSSELILAKLYTKEKHDFDKAKIKIEEVKITKFYAYFTII